MRVFDGEIIEIYLVIAQVQHQVRDLVFVQQEFVQAVCNSPVIPGVRRDAVIAQEGSVVRRTMVGCQEHGVISLAQLGIQEGEERGEIFVKPEVSIFYLYRIWSELVAHIVCR